MLKLIRQLLGDRNCPDAIVLWAAIITAFHLFARSAEHLAKLSGGKFDLESVCLLAGLVFYFAGNVISFAEALNPDSSLHASQVQVTFGKTKNGGGEVRTLNALDYPLCPVHALALMVTVVLVKKVVPDERGRVPLFGWGTGSTQASDGATYRDDIVQTMLKQVAT